MFYETKTNNHGLKHNPFKSCIIPRPIAWITTISNDGIDNCAPYSFFNGVSSDPPMVMFANNGSAIDGSGPRDTFSNIKENQEFVINISTFNTKDKMNKTSARLCRNVSEIEFASLETLDSRLVKPKRLKESPINMECTLYKIIDLPGITEDNYNGILIGKVIGIHINDEYIKDGKVDVKKIKPLARLGYFDYSVIDDFFSIKRPK
ncbi:MAG: flavin reductase family protein [Pseudomonadota bacterium]|nr:flavin reductase family protein [Pseudomonadota bacterium]